MKIWMLSSFPLSCTSKPQVLPSHGDHTKMCMVEVKVTGAIYDYTIQKVTSEGVGKNSPAGLSAHTAGLSTL